MPRHALLTDRQWDRTRPLLPSSTGRRGRPWDDHRRIVEACVYQYRTGIPWRDLPARFGSWKTVWARYRRWAADRTWDRVLGVLLARADNDGLIDWRVAGGGWRWTPPSPGPTSTPPTPAAREVPGRSPRAGPRRPPRARRARDRSFPRRADHEDPPRRGRPGPTAGRRRDARPGARRPSPCRCCWETCVSHAPEEADPARGRPSLPIRHTPPAPSGLASGAAGSRPPSPNTLTRSPTGGDGAAAADAGPPAQTVPGRRNPLRRTRHPLPGGTAPRLAHPLAPRHHTVIKRCRLPGSVRESRLRDRQCAEPRHELNLLL
jgi:transposase